MTVIPGPIRAEFKRREHLTAWAAGVCVGLCGCVYMMLPSYLPLAIVLSSLAVLTTTVRCILFGLSVPKLSARWYADQERRREQQAERDRVAALRAAEHAQRQEELRLAKLEEFHSVLEAPSGTKHSLSTRYGDFWVTNCRDGSVRFWWPPFGHLKEHALHIVRGKGGWARDSGEGWFVPRVNAQHVLTALASL